MTNHPTSGVVPAAPSEKMFVHIIDHLEKCKMPNEYADRILVRYIDHLRFAVAHPDEPTDQMQGCVKLVLSVFPRVQAFRLLPQIFVALEAFRRGDVDRAADTLLCVECALTLAVVAA